MVPLPLIRETLQKPSAANVTIPSPDPFELVGTTIAGKYDVEEIVAQTALSVVYRATHRVWQRRVAIKAFTAPSLSEEMHQLIGGSKLVIFPQSGHMNFVDQPAMFNKTVNDFLAP